MKQALLLATLALSLAACSSVTPAPEATELTSQAFNKRVIFDSDFGYDVDDAGALAVLHALDNRGELSIQAVISTVGDPDSIGAMDAINNYYRRGWLPLGQYKGSKWRTAYGYWGNYGDYIRHLDDTYSNDASISSVSSAVTQYRRALARSPDNSVTIISVGFLQNLSDLLGSRPDSISGLSGKSLVDRKVRELIVTGGGYPSGRDLNLTGGRYGNSIATSQNVVNNWPTVITFNPLCHNVATGSVLRHTSWSNPVRAAYRVYLGGDGRSRPSWDLCSVLYAARGGSYFSASSSRLMIDGGGTHRWSGGSKHRRLNLKVSATTMQSVLNGLLMAPR